MPKPTKKTKGVTVKLDVTREDLEIIAGAANVLGLSVNEYIEMCALHRALGIILTPR